MMSEHNQLVNFLDSVLLDYHPSDKICYEIGRRSMIMFSGPFAVGKTTLMQNIEKSDDRFSRTRSFTTRPCRDSSEYENYRFIPHTRKNLHQIIEKAIYRDLVQGMVHPTTGFVYGSELSDYGNGNIALLDVVPKATTQIEGLPFRDIRLVEVVASPDTWYTRVSQRGDQHSDADKAARLLEAKQNLEWALGRRDVLWIDNSGDIEDVLHDIFATIDGDKDRSLNAQRLGIELLRLINTLNNTPS